ncbi:PREDICTED: uncharacterized protein LOC105134716 isoform X2 [Populus euphratica]|uniref:Uncharacterized protein LOC105134716 isoform X1 n=1 Tax=Populus euphratica TaxID=75702 RepID=A0AAJ6UX39_POPEU|nr:PREDICTED: uncharacterized protein LOC105134716 isoform X1 [Populus euphratica]XP_011037530.1 PREDICTED: uncharacterized protein LOC105134716 isoform X2 [Populus euphratica]
MLQPVLCYNCSCDRNSSVLVFLVSYVASDCRDFFKDLNLIPPKINTLSSFLSSYGPQALCFSFAFRTLLLSDYSNLKLETEDCRHLYPGTEFMDVEDGEMSWFYADVRVGVGIGPSICVGIGIGVPCGLGGSNLQRHHPKLKAILVMNRIYPLRHVNEHPVLTYTSCWFCLLVFCFTGVKSFVAPIIAPCTA